jgi:hypothetical protein
MPCDQELIVQYRIENFKTVPVQLDILEDMNQLRNAFCGNRDNFDVEWEIIPDGASLKPAQVERQDVSHVQYHVPLKAAPKDETKDKRLNWSATFDNNTTWYHQELSYDARSHVINWRIPDQK